jgi:riboflavin synthase
VFTGLVQALGRIRSIDPRATATRLVVDTAGWPHRPDLGASISVNGCCLTVVEVAADGALSFDVIPQTLAVTGLGRLRVGDGVNLEHAATPTTFLGGHVVLGHVDGLATVERVATDGEWRVRLRLPGELGRHAVDKGSIALDGVSLTLAHVEPVETASGGGGVAIEVCLIPETLARTNLAERRAGDVVHVEVDYLSKLVARQLEWIERARR